MQNTLPATPEARAPRGIVSPQRRAGGRLGRFTVTNNTYYQADTFRVNFAEGLLPPDRDANWLSALTEGFVEPLPAFRQTPRTSPSATLPARSTVGLTTSSTTRRADW